MGDFAVMLKHMPASGIPPQAVTIEALGSVLTITVNKEFDFGLLSQDWANTIAVSWTNAYSQVRVDMSHCGLVSSTFFAGLVQLFQHYGRNGSTTIVLVGPDPRVIKNLKILRLDTLFAIEPRA